MLVGTATPKEYASWCAHIKSFECEDAAEAERVNSNRPASPVQPAQPGVQRQPSQVLPGPQFPPDELRPTPEIEMTMGATGQQRRAAWVSQEERNRRFTVCLCRRCGGSGHIIKNCPYLAARRPTPAVQQINPGPVLEPIPAGIELPNMHLNQSRYMALGFSNIEICRVINELGERIVSAQIGVIRRTRTMNRKQWTPVIVSDSSHSLLRHACCITGPL